MPEFQDIYDIHRNLTGRRVARGTRRAADEYIQVVHILIFDRDGRFLVQQRVDDKASWPGMWDISVGGIAQTGDDSCRAAEREILEELGLTVDLTDTEPIFTFRAGNTFDDYWLIRLDTVDPPLRLQKEEVQAVRWVDKAGWEALVASHNVIPYSFHSILFDLYEKQFPGTRLYPFGSPARVLGAVFDMDGLLLDTERVTREAWRKAAPEFGIEDIDPILDACIGLNEAGDRAVFRSRLGDAFDYEGFRARTRAMSHAITDVKVPVKAGAAAILETLHAAGVKLAVASSTRAVTVKDQLDRAGLLRYFDAVVTGDTVTHGKPHPEIYQKACDALGLDPTACIAFEDSRNGLRSAFRAAVYPVQVPDLVPPNVESNALSWKTFASLEDARAWLLSPAAPPLGAAD